MKLHIGALILLAVGSISHAAEEQKCPDASEIPDCNCYNTIHSIICEKPEVKQFNLQHSYSLNSMIIRNSKKLYSLRDTFDNDHRMILKTLTIKQDAQSANSVKMQNLESLFGVTTKAIKIESSDVTGSAPLDITDLGDNMESIIFTNITFQKFDVAKFSTNNLNHLVLKNIGSYETPDDIVLLESHLNSLEISGFADFEGAVFYEPAQCSPDVPRINIRIRENSQMKNFDFSRLFPLNGSGKPDDKCNYHIDLSDNESLEETMLVDQVKTLQAAPENRLYLILRNARKGAPFACNCEVWKAFDKRKDYFHGIRCKTDLEKNPKTDYINRLAQEDFANCKTTP